MAKYFKEEEFTCKCGCDRVAVSKKLLEKLDRARELYGRPIYINSGFRCEAHNQRVGGKPDSAHLFGAAADMPCVGSRNRFELLFALLGAGFKRIGVAEKFIHADVDGTKAESVIWLYKE